MWHFVLVPSCGWIRIFDLAINCRLSYLCALIIILEICEEFYQNFPECDCKAERQDTRQLIERLKIRMQPPLGTRTKCHKNIFRITKPTLVSWINMQTIFLFFVSCLQKTCLIFRYLSHLVSAWIICGPSYYFDCCKIQFCVYDSCLILILN